MDLVVLKVSGHLINLPNKVKDLMNVVAKLNSERTRIAIVPGGSIFSDLVKEIQDNTEIDDDTAHWMAIKSMEIYGLYLKHFNTNCVEAYTIDDVYKALSLRPIPIVMPYQILKTYDELPHTWVITSDSISIFIAKLLRANMVLLGKMVNGITNEKGEIMKIIKSDDIKRQNVFDSYTINMVKMYKIPLIIFNVLRPELLYKIVSMEEDTYTIVMP
ncbi:MAG: hypothetical protein QXM83_00785 [Ignisphaera sp.]